MEIKELESILEKCWSKETSVDIVNWSHKNPAWGQCAVTSLIVNDYLGGEIVWAAAILPDGRDISHYFNKIDGKEIDLTSKQFPQGTVIPEGTERKKWFPTTREYVLSYVQTQKRYEILKEKVENFNKKAY